jgi:hypothetical protein
VGQRPHDGGVAIFAAASTPLSGGAILRAAPFFAERLFARAREGNGNMRRFGSMLRSMRSRIGRRLAEIVAIAAASLPAAGA